MEHRQLQQLLEKLSIDSRELSVASQVDRIPPPTPLEFYRDYVAPNKPCVIVGAIDHWPALHKWTDQYLAAALGDSPVTVALTPNGRADAVTPLPQHAGGATAAGECFALPHQEQLSMREFLGLLAASRHTPGSSGGSRHGSAQRQPQQCGGAGDAAEGASGRPSLVPYLQFQNSSLTAEAPQLLEDVDPDIRLFTQALGEAPEAVNLWIGDGRSTSSLHKDPFENAYAVVAGEKTFTLLPPSDVWRVGLRRYPLATYLPVGSAGGSSTGAGAGGGSDSITGASGEQQQQQGGEGEEDGEGNAARDSSGSRVEQLLALRLEPVLHQPAEQVLWSSINPEALIVACCGSSTGCGSEGEEASTASASAGAEQQGKDSSGSSRGGGVGPGTMASYNSSAATGGQLLGGPGVPRPLRVTVRKGELLYLPAMWWHQVEQQEDESGRVIAVNYWYDLRFDQRHALVGSIEALAEAACFNERPPGC